MCAWFDWLGGVLRLLAELVSGVGCWALVDAALEVRVVWVRVDLEAGAGFGGAHVVLAWRVC